MKSTDSNADKTPRPIPSDQAQQGEPSPDPVLERPDPATETVDKVITPTSIKEQAEQADEIKRRLADAERKSRG